VTALDGPLGILVDLLLGAALGFLGGLFGIGGGMLAIPALGALYGQAQQLAQGTSLIIVLPTVALGLWRYRARNAIALGDACAIALPAVVCNALAARLALQLPGGPLRLAFGLFLLGVGAWSLWRSTGDRRTFRALGNVEAGVASGNALVRHAVGDRRRLVAVGLLGGAASGLFGVGGGLIAPVLLNRWLGRTQTAAQGLSLAMVLPGAAVALGVYAHGDQVAWSIGLPMAAGGLLLVTPGVRLAHHLAEHTLRHAFAIMLLVIGAGLAAAVLLS